MRYLAAILVFTLSACGPVWHKSRDTTGIPRFTVEAYDEAESLKICSAFGSPTIGCTIHALGRCTMIVPPDRSDVREHEAKHCDGWSHK